MKTRFAVWMTMVAVGVAVGAGEARGQSKHWASGSPASWFSPTFWSPQGVPGDAHLAYIGSVAGAGPCIVNVRGALAGAVNVTGVSVPGELRIQLGGQLEVVEGVVIGSDAGRAGSVQVSGASLEMGPEGVVFVGEGGIGTLEVTSGGLVQCYGLQMASGADSVGTTMVSGAGSLIDTGLIFLGVDGMGGLEVESGGSVQCDWMQLAWGAAGVGTAAVSGAGASINASEEILVGIDGTGGLEVENGGSVQCDDLRAAWGVGSVGTVTVGSEGTVQCNTLQLARGTDSFATLAVSGNGAVVNGLSWLLIGDPGDAEMSVTDGGVVTSGRALIALDTECTGDVLVAGPGTRWDVGAYILVGELGDGRLTVSDGGLVRSSYIGLSAAFTSSGTLNVGAAAGIPAAAPGMLDTGSISGGSGTGVVNFNHTGTLDLVRPSSAPIAIEGAVHVNKEGPGVTILRATNSSYTDGTSVSAGVLRAVANGSLGANGGAVTLKTGGVLMNQDSNLDLAAGRSIVLGGGEGRLRAGWEKTFTVNGPISGPGDLVVTDDSGVVVLAGAAKTYSGATIIGRDVANGGFGTTSTLRLGADDVLPTGTHLRFHAGAGGSATLDLNGRAQRVRSASFASGSASLTGGGQLTVWGAPSGSPVAGTLAVSGPTTLALDGGVMSITEVHLASTAALRGNGIVGAMTLGAGATLAPGASVGAIFGGATTIQGGAVLEWEMAQTDLDDFDGWGVGWDGYGTFNTITLNATPENPVTLRISTLDANTGLPGKAAGFDPAQADSWLLMGGSSVSGFDPAAFVIDASGFANSYNGTFSVRLATGDSIMLDYTPGAAGAGDCDGNGSVNLIDFSTFSSCFAGPGVAYDPGCGCADMDGDGDVDLADFSSFSTAITG